MCFFNSKYSRYYTTCSWESADVEVQTRRADHTLYVDFYLCRGSVPLTPHCSRVDCIFYLESYLSVGVKNIVSEVTPPRLKSQLEHFIV